MDKVKEFLLNELNQSPRAFTYTPQGFNEIAKLMDVSGFNGEDIIRVVGIKKDAIVISNNIESADKLIRLKCTYGAPKC